MMAKTIQGTAHREDIILTKALKNAADYWGINNKQLGEIIGLSEATISRLKNDQYLLDHHSKQWQLAILFLRIFRGLDCYMGGNTENECLWLKSHNIALGGTPFELMRNVEGLTRVVQYVDYMRGQ
ncbi:MAG: MbcA/ParS/Xre antitoxin family protein [Alphaproteobacteria bacterium]